MPLPLVSALSLLLAVSPGATGPNPDAGAKTRQPQTATCGDEHWPTLGSPQALVRIRVYVDPGSTHALQMWLEARQLVAERPGEVLVQMVPAPGGPSVALTSRQRSLLRWFHVAAAHDRAESALRAIDHRGALEIQNLLLKPEGRRVLSEEVGLDADGVEAALTGSSLRCVDRRIETAMRRFESATKSILGRSRPPLVGLSTAGHPETVFAENERMTEIRSRIGELLKHPIRSTPRQPAPLLSTRSEALTYDRTYAGTGILVGGDALENRLLVLAENEDEGRLLGILEPGLRFRSDEPGLLSIQVIATGSSTRAIRLRRRLCAARKLGLEVEYARYLAQPLERRPVIANTTKVLEALDEVAASDHCSDEEPLEAPEVTHDESPQGGPVVRRRSPTPRGAWLNGRPVSPGEMENLDLRFWTRQPSNVLDWLWQPEPPE